MLISVDLPQAALQGSRKGWGQSASTQQSMNWSLPGAPLPNPGKHNSGKFYYLSSDRPGVEKTFWIILCSRQTGQLQICSELSSMVPGMGPFPEF